MTLRQKLRMYMLNEDKDLLKDIEHHLPFANEQEHQEWLELPPLETKWLKMTKKLIKREENILYHVGIKGNSSYLLYGEVEYTLKDYWTTVKMGDGATETHIKLSAKENLQKQISKDLYGTPKLWKRIVLDNSDIVIVRV
jgi:hypothetical protein